MNKKFKEGDLVYVLTGLYRGRTGIVYGVATTLLGFKTEKGEPFVTQMVNCIHAENEE